MSGYTVSELQIYHKMLQSSREGKGRAGAWTFKVRIWSKLGNSDCFLHAHPSCEGTLQLSWDKVLREGRVHKDKNRMDFQGFPV